ncbi:nuclear transport factor 2 family protein [Flavobacterium silvaticum]|uniref:Nuclear transport factor 2 family protein n=1 Tax=Flavobacterium silvaticum TaxID=1852020 RepID=A0A972FNW1_9FLAO|nr:nuclear transport factor 2 family protein [Flavobacterium silvaticum]NMH26704.1 nuclear transport factor 2 family protein [Flavobacterium silvaticum]
MKRYFPILVFPILMCFIACRSGQNQIPKYEPVDKKVFDEIAAMDKTFFDAYNNCDLEKQASIYADNIEFFHDKGGLMQSKSELIEATKKNICGKVSRQLIEGSIEVYPINGYGAVEIGFHKFFNNQEPDAESKPSKFIIIWKNENGTWKIAKVVSLH